MTFEELELDPVLLAAIEEQHFHKPTPVQAEVIPEFILRKDILAGAATGTGKTAAFVLPMLQVLLDEPRPSKLPRALILAPTRELAFQIHKVVKQLGTHCEFRSNIVTGGFASDKQLDNLTGPLDILVATPGRLLNIMSKEFIDLSYIDMVIIDEADRMLDMGQGPDVLALLEAIPTDFQAACFSATLGGSGVERFAEDILDDPVIVQIDAPNQQSQQVQQQLYFADDRDHKRALLKNMLEDDSCKSALVFCNKRDRAIELEAWLLEQDVSADVLHGDMIQAKRLEITKKFTQGKTKVLVATDVAARGLDMLNITHVINYDLPHRGDIYIHRIGRTGRGQNVGIAISLVEPHDLKQVERIQYHMQAKIPVHKIEGLEPKFNTGKAKKTVKKPHKKKLAKKAAKAKKTAKKK
ncbi:DEAD/DEAH box helicase [Hydrogenovibrio sp. JE_KL2]|uniref:DEAD/DEAH box helicase n=1 Tax=Hydrogenovibrio sp. JE_KL2 TaxID=2651188 RepID=UPI00128E23D2|nr:DEAD/DEAH box helicase [Hydrogenovibrio sp. JE_KL2]MPQ76690.1 DEAD/DEAH box helicase [Hydrogenovibrio sp. JE_KL2]